MKTYSWLAYDEKEDYMYCKVCTEHKKKNRMCKVARCKNFQNTTLVRHAALSDHQMALQKPQIPKQFEAIKEKAESQQNKAVMVLLKCVHWLCVEGLPLVQFKSLLELLHDLGLEDIAILKQSANIHYESYITYNDILDCLSDLLEDELKERLSKSSVVTVLADESTDIANVKRLGIYTQIISEAMKPSTHYVTNIECTDSTGVGIANEIMSEFHKIGVSCNTCTTGLTLAVHTARCERSFSVQNNILTPSRNRLKPVVQQKLIRVKLGPERASFNFQAALLKWRAVKDRRIYKLKKTNPNNFIF